MPSAAILAFPPRSEHCRAFAGRLASVVVHNWTDRHIPVVAAVVDLLDLDDASASVHLVFQALALVRSRITVGLADGGAR